MITPFELKLPGFKYGDIYEAERLPVLDSLFMNFVDDHDRELASIYRTYRNGVKIRAVEEATLLINIARHLEDFLVSAFAVETARSSLRRQQMLDEPVHAFKDKFIKPLIRRKTPALRTFQAIDSLLQQKLGSNHQSDRELAVAQLWFLATESGENDTLELLAEWVNAAYTTPEGRASVRGWISFKFPHKIEYMKLVPTVPVETISA